MKFNNDHSSAKLFYRGVPVKRSLLSACKCFNSFTSLYLKFFNLCPSSTTTYFPFIMPQTSLCITHCHLIKSNNYRKLGANYFRHVLPTNLIPFFLVSMINNCIDRGRKPFNLIYPIKKCRERSNNQIGSIHPVSFQMSKKSNCLNRLSKTHLICKDPIQPIFP